MPMLQVYRSSMRMGMMQDPFAADSEAFALARPGAVGPGAPIDPARLERMVGAFQRNGDVVDQGAGAQAYLQMRGAEGLTLNADTILLPPNPNTSSVFEEFIHSAQFRTGRVDAYTDLYGNAGAQTRLEIDAAEKLITNRSAYRIPNSETRQTIQRLRDYRTQLGN